MKFKIWDLKNQKAYGYEILTDRGWKCKSLEQDEYSNGVFLFDEPNRFHRAFFSNATDKNNIELYSGDEVMDSAGRRAIVVYNGTKFLLQYDNRAEDLTYLNSKYIKKVLKSDKIEYRR